MAALSLHAPPAEGAEGSEAPAVEEPAAPRPIFSLHVLPFVTDLQQQNGLRHEDYQRYRQFCTRRLGRVRKIVKFGHGRKFTKKAVTADRVVDGRFLHIPLLQAERAWSYYMQLKHLVDETAHGSRKLFHSRSRLRKAAAHAHVLRELACTPGLCDPRTELEATAYADWLQGCLAFEMERWDEAMDKLQRARFIYERLASLCDPGHRTLYTQRIDEIDANVKFSAFSKSGSAGLEDLLKMQQAARVGALAEELASKIDLAVAHTRQAQSGLVSEITWHGQTIAIKNEKLREHLQRARAKEFDIDQKLRDAGNVEVAGLYDELFMAYGDATRVVSDDLHLAGAKEGKTVSQKVETNIALLRTLQNYLTFLKLSRLMERTQHMLAHQAIKPSDRVHLYDSLLQNVAEIADLPEQRDDVSSAQWAAAQSLLFKALRTHSIAESQRLAGKVPETLALYDRAVAHAMMARAQFQDCPGDNTTSITQLDELLRTVRGAKCVLKAARLSAGEQAAAAALDLTRPVLEQLGVYCDDLATFKQGRLVDFPPDFQPIPCKPLFFDLANNHVAYPSLADRTSSMLGGLLKGIFGKK